jgi:hypothetical protein
MIFSQRDDFHVPIDATWCKSYTGFLNTQLQMLIPNYSQFSSYRILTTFEGAGHKFQVWLFINGLENANIFIRSREENNNQINSGWRCRLLQLQKSWTDFYSSPVSISSQQIIHDLKANSLYVCSSCRDHVPQSKRNSAGIRTASTDIRRDGQKRRRKIKNCNKKNLNDASLCPSSNYVIEIEIDIKHKIINPT